MKFRALPFAAALLAVAFLAFAGSLQAGETSVAQFSTADATYFSVALTPEIEEAPVATRDIVILVDTSASQVGEFRNRTFQVLESTLNSLSANDRVRIMTVDISAVPMTDSFVATDSPEINDALIALEEDSVPLGATDMNIALRAAHEALRTSEAEARAVLYIGDGMSNANILASEEFGSLLDTLYQQRTPVTSYAVGPQTNMMLLAALAAQTGGMVAGADESDDIAATGMHLASALEATVLWPTAATPWPAGWTVYPNRLPPLRSDRETIVAGQSLDILSPCNMRIQASNDTDEQLMSFDVVPSVTSDDNSYLKQIVEMAESTGGVALPLVDQYAVEAIQRNLSASVLGTLDMATMALNRGELEQAEALAQHAQEVQPSNMEAETVLQAVGMMRTQETVPTDPFAPFEPVEPVGPVADAVEDVQDTPTIPSLEIQDPPALPAPSAEPSLILQSTPEVGVIDADPLAAPGALVDSFQHDRTVYVQAMIAEVKATLNQARTEMDSDPEGVLQALKLQMSVVREAPDLEPSRRAALISELTRAIRDTEYQVYENELQQQASREIVARRQTEILAAQLVITEEMRLQQIFQRYASLMAEPGTDPGPRIAAEDAVMEVREMDPTNTAAYQGIFTARQTRHVLENYKLRDDRQRGVLDVLMSVERSHVPLSDEPPILYPDAEVWQQLSAYRLEHYGSIDLSSTSNNEKKILAALDNETSVDAVASPLEDVINDWKLEQGIEIQFDTNPLRDFGIDPEMEEITRVVSGISFRSALKLILEDIGLTYTIRNEVLLITTIDQAKEYLTTKVYPVADIVMPTTPLGGGMGGGGMQSMGMMGGMGGGMMGGGSMGGSMGGMGGMGGGMGGMGGGMGGMGGMGGGQWNVAPEADADLMNPAPEAATVNRFDVPSELDLRDTTPRTSVDAYEIPSDLMAAPAFVSIDLDRPSDMTAKTFWRNYFTELGVAETREDRNQTLLALHDAARRLGSTRRVDDMTDVIELCKGALRNGYEDLWMYEVMSIAMQVTGAPKSEMERVLMSAVDFCQNPRDLAYIAQYMARVGLQSRALSLFRQVTEVAPNQAEAYLAAIQIALTYDDQEAMQWACLGIIGQAWPREQAVIFEDAVLTAHAILTDMRNAGEIEAADSFEAALDAAIVRDLIVEVSWTGEGDVDLAVREPSGTVCDLVQMRTSSGGVMSGDDFHIDNESRCVELYACPRAFAGDYDIIIRRAHGDVTANKVNIKVYTHYGTEEGLVFEQSIDLAASSQIMQFNLDKGRRIEPIADHVLANAVEEQQRVSREVGSAILAQQLRNSVDGGSMADGSYSRGGPVNYQNPNQQFVRPQGAVGYMPQITQLSAGASLSAVAVVSADRRYVRISPSPMFSGVGEVNVFSTGDGQQSAGTGGNQSGGYSGGSSGGGGYGGSSGGYGGSSGGYGGY